MHISVEKNSHYSYEFETPIVGVTSNSRNVFTKKYGNILLVVPRKNFVGQEAIKVKFESQDNIDINIIVTEKELMKYEELSLSATQYLLDNKHAHAESWFKDFKQDGLNFESEEDFFLNFKPSVPKKYVVLNKFKTNVEFSSRIYNFQNYKPYSLSFPINWGENKKPYNTRSWQYSLNAWFFLDSLIENGSKDKIDYALQIAWDWIKFNVVECLPNDHAWYDMAVAIRAPKLAYLFSYGIENGSLSDDQIKWFAITIIMHIKDLTSQRKLALHSNHGLYQLSGLLGLVSILPEIDNSNVIGEFATRLFSNVANTDISKEGIHLEHSPAYHIFMLEAISNLIRCGWLKDEKLSEKLSRMEHVAKFMFHPNGRYLRFGDTSDRLARHVIPDSSEYLTYLKNSGEVGEPYSDNSLVLPESGYFYHRSDWHLNSDNCSYLAFNSAFHKRTHKHADDFTFEWSELSQRILVDAGMYGYERDAIERDYVQSTRAHNCVEIDGKDYSRYNLDIYGSALSAWSDKEEVKVVESYLYRKRFFKTHHRRIIFLRPGKWLLVVDHLKSTDKHEYTQWFHFDPSLELFQSLDEVRLDINKDNRLWINNFNKEEKILHVKAQFEPRLQGWTSIEPYQLTPNDALGFTVNDSYEHTFATLFSMSSNANRPEPIAFNSSSNGKYLRIKWVNPEGQIEDIVYRIATDSRTLTVNDLDIPVTIRNKSAK